MTRIAKWLFLASLLIALCGPTAHAQIINATNCSSTAVQTALNSVVADGTTVVIPSGNCTWTTMVSYSKSFSVTIQGQSTTSGTCAPGGSCTAVDNTIITDNLTRGAACGSPDGPALQISSTIGKTIRLTGITWLKTGAGQTCVGTVSVGGTGQQTRIDHNHFSTYSFVALGWGGFTYGLVDHNLFNGSGTVNTIVFHEPNWIGLDGNPDPLNVGDGSWADNSYFGTIKSVYVENNGFIVANGSQNHGSGYADDCTSGGRFVWRFNLMQNVMLQTHPTGGGQRHRGCRALEVYGNTFTATGTGNNNMFNAFWFSSGAGLVWNNTTSPSGGWDQFVTVHSMRRNTNTYTQNPTPSGWGYCGTSQNGTGSNWDQNTNSSSGRKCIDRPGMGKGDRLVNDFPNTTNNATGCSPSSACAWPRQQLEPAYEWLNTSQAGFFWNVADGELIGNEDYYNYTGSFNGTSGVGSGTLANRPATCTPNPDSGAIGGVAYWATDQGNWNKSGSGGQGQLYSCTSTNTWSLYYTPLTYPHPLVVGSGPLPTPPTGLAAIVN